MLEARELKSIESLYNEHYTHLSENELYIFDYVMKNMSMVSRISITDLAKKLSVSKSTISRFTQKISFSGFSEFKFYLTDALKSPSSSKKEKSIEHVMIDLAATYKLFNQADVQAIIQKIYTAHDIFCYGTGWGQRNALDDFRRSMLLCNKYTNEISAHTELEIVSRSAQENDALIIASLSGNVESIEKELNIFKSRGAVIIAITSIQASLLARIADYTIYFQTTSIPYNNNDMVSFLPVGQVTNMLCLEYFDFIRLKKKIDWEE